MERPFPLGNKPLRLAMLGMVDGNGHPYSWSAIFNGYDRAAMEKCPFAGIPQYLFREPEAGMTIPNARVTHIWTDNSRDAQDVARASRIPHVLERPEQAIDQVDAVLVATDKGHEHVERCRSFVEAGVPVFVDKPMVDNEADLQTFTRWVREGAPILSSSAMRYAKEFLPYRASTHDLGRLCYAGITMAKSWERYGIHALESVYPIVGPGFESVQHTGDSERAVVHLRHGTGVDVTAIVTEGMYGGFGHLTLAGTESSVAVKSNDTFYSFKAQLEAYVEFLRTGRRPFPFEETVELMKLVIGGIRSRDEGGRRVYLDEIKA